MINKIEVILTYSGLSTAERAAFCLDLLVKKKFDGREASCAWILTEYSH
jgi:hypothetical protein